MRAVVWVLSGLVFALSQSSCSSPPRFSYVVDPSLQPSIAQVPGLDGGPPREVAVVAGPDGKRTEFVVNEIQVHLTDQAQLSALVAKYHGAILRDGTPPVIPGGRPRGTPESSHDYLIRVDLASSSVDDLEDNMRAADLLGRHVFSSSDAVRLVALVARERPLRVGLNFVMQPLFQIDPSSIENNGTDAANWSWMAAAGVPNSLGIGVIQAWNYAKYKGLPAPPGGVYTPPIVAIIDDGFDLDGTGKPNDNNIDYHFFGNAPIQYDLINHSGSAGGPGYPGRPEAKWHGQQVFSIAAAYPRNNFGTAGTGGEAVLPMLIRWDSTSSGAGDAVRAAAFNGASVVNMSLGCEPPKTAECNLFDGAENLQRSINIAASWNQNGKLIGTIVVASAGNSNQSDNNQFDNVPCTMNNVVCVGAIRQYPPATSENYPWNTSGAGGRVAIWAPDCIFSTPVKPDITVLPTFCGTSAASPFVAGIVALMKGLQPSLSATDVISVLRKTARKSADPRVVPGYIDALAALREVSPNQPPTINIVEPASGTQVPWGQVHLAANVNDPDDFQTPGSIDGLTITWESDRDGALCSGLDCNAVLKTVGAHTITATVRDPFGMPGNASISLQAIEVLPTVTIFAPQNGQTFAAAGLIELRGFATSPSETIPDANLVWTSSLAGTLGNRHIYETRLPPGQQTVTLMATDSHNFQASAAVTVNVVSDDIPAPQILAPVRDPISDYASIADGSVTLVGSAFDPVDGDEPDAQLSWSSDVMGPLGTGKNRPVNNLTFGSCAPIVHVITLTATNKAGKQATTSIRISAGTIC